jgi:hypothetical protein
MIIKEENKKYKNINRYTIGKTTRKNKRVPIYKTKRNLSRIKRFF